MDRQRIWHGSFAPDSRSGSASTASGATAQEACGLIARASQARPVSCPELIVKAGGGFGGEKTIRRGLTAGIVYDADSMNDRYWQDVHAATADDLAAVNYPSLPVAFNRLVDGIFRNTFERVTSKLEPGRALEVGCGRGRWMKRLAARGWNTVGVDIAANARADAIASADKLPVIGDSFDLVMAITVLQHIDRKEEALREMIRATKKGGRILLIELIDRPGIMWQSHVLPQTATWWRDQFRVHGVNLEYEEPVEYLPILRLLERVRSRPQSRISTNAAPSNPRPGSAAKRAAWNLITLLSYPLEPVARMLIPESASHRLFLCRKI